MNTPFVIFVSEFLITKPYANLIIISLFNINITKFVNNIKEEATLFVYTLIGCIFSYWSSSIFLIQTLLILCVLFLGFSTIWL